ncbi:MAG: DUF1501 domain-containing protein [Verrucomicrobiae bacterium]|nr:DUF1501 domain-containing protein [Verrucomicrobiae bacterium]
MKRHQKEERATRREFVRQSACAALGVTGLVNTLAQLRLITAAMAQSTPGDYKALVCLFLNGGNDSNNLLVPSGDPATDSLRYDYQTARGILALDRSLLAPLTVPPTTDCFDQYHGGIVHPLGVHPSAAKLATLFNSGELAFVSNVGTLAYPIPTRTHYINNLVPVPPQLFSHSDQQVQWQSSIPDRPFTSGWGGRAADLLNSSYNAPGSKVSMSISLAGINSFQIGTTGEVQQYVVGTGGATSLSGYGANYSSALATNSTWQNPVYLSGDAGTRLRAFESIVKLAHENLLENEYNQIITRSRLAEGVIGAALTEAAATGVDFDGIFNTGFNVGGGGTVTSLGLQMKMIARLIGGRNALGNKRQVFFCQVGGYDTHQTMLASHSNLMAELANALKAFRDCLVDLGVFGDVVTFTASDFNRTMTPNGTDANAGSDHAWGGNAIVMGGAVNGGNIYGHFPSLKTGSQPGSIDAHTNRGRWIPSVSVDQYSAVLAKWLGAGSSEIEAIFPNLPRFDDPFTSSTPNLGFL